MQSQHISTCTAPGLSTCSAIHPPDSLRLRTPPTKPQTKGLKLSRVWTHFNQPFPPCLCSYRHYSFIHLFTPGRFRMLTSQNDVFLWKACMDTMMGGIKFDFKHKTGDQCDCERRESGHPKHPPHQPPNTHHPFLFPVSDGQRGLC